MEKDNNNNNYNDNQEGGERELNDQEKKWAAQQEELRLKLITNDTEPWSNSLESTKKLRYIAGLDVSYDKNHPNKGCAALVIYDLLSQKLVYQDTCFVNVCIDYSAGFLAFREVDFLLNLVLKFHTNEPQEEPIQPQVWLVDGNGLLHPRKFGLACHLGVLMDQPTIGISKNPYFFQHGPTNKARFKKDLEGALHHRGDQFEILYNDNHNQQVMGVALKTVEHAKNPVYVSIGHRVSLKTAVKVVLKCCLNFKNPEPLRQADMISKEALRKTIREKSL